MLFSPAIYLAMADDNAPAPAPPPTVAAEGWSYCLFGLLTLKFDRGPVHHLGHKSSKDLVWLCHELLESKICDEKSRSFTQAACWEPLWCPQQLIKCTATSEQLKLHQLISEEELGDRKPTQLLRHMEQLLGDKLSTSDDAMSFLCELF